MSGKSPASTRNTCASIRHPATAPTKGAPTAVSANLGVNPSLTITAQAERALAMWPNAGEADPRPELGASYRPVEPVEPHRPTVPAHAPGALRLPITPVSDATRAG